MIRTDAVPAVATRPAGICAVSCVGLTNEVAKDAPFHWIAEPVTKPVPAAVSVKPGEPAGTELGLMAESVGGGRWETVKVNALEAGTPDARTVIGTLPGTRASWP